METRLLRAGFDQDEVESELATLERVHLQGNRESSLLLGKSETTAAPRLLARDLVIDGTLAAACADLEPGAPGSCKEDRWTSHGGGSGLVILDGASAEVSGFDIARSFLAGIQVGKGSSLRLDSGTIRQNAVGANLQEPGFDQSLVINETVRYTENETNLSAESLPLPVCEPPRLPSS